MRRKLLVFWNALITLSARRLHIPLLRFGAPTGLIFVVLVVTAGGISFKLYGTQTPVVRNQKESKEKESAVPFQRKAKQGSENVLKMASDSAVSPGTAARDKSAGPAWHPQDWLQQHLAKAKSEPGYCVTCHTEKFCISCHTERVPASHRSAAWLQNHDSQAEWGQCTTCHRQRFCMSCHQKNKPDNHGANWLRLHGTESAKDSKYCDTCHTQQSCRSCHGLAMPHPQNWGKTHPSFATSRPGTCEKCHKTDYCAACHKTSRPKSHSGSWLNAHALTTQVDDGSCTTCHTGSYCSDCHKATRPTSHETDWLKTHGKAGIAGMESCVGCHDEQKYCDSCHGLEMPHPKGWMIGHKDKGGSLEPDGNCMKCHQRKSCLCHGAG